MELPRRALHVLQEIINFCTSYSGLLWLALASDLAIAVAYFAIPITMAVVLRHRKDDIPYPWLWTLFVTFIVACGMTHLVHVWSAMTGSQYLGAQVTIGVITALASVGTAVAFALILPQIKNLPSPRQQTALLEQMVLARTAEKDQLIREINHRVGNQLQILSSLVRLEQRNAGSEEAQDILDRLRRELEKMNERHHTHSRADYLAPEMEEDRLSA
jgi:two-component sensor histidine kinase